MKKGHDGDCTIYAVMLGTDSPEAGICTCGYGLQEKRKLNFEYMYSKERLADMERKANIIRGYKLKH